MMETERRLCERSRAARLRRNDAAFVFLRCHPCGSPAASTASCSAFGMARNKQGLRASWCRQRGNGAWGIPQILLSPAVGKLLDQFVEMADFPRRLRTEARNQTAASGVRHKRSTVCILRVCDIMKVSKIAIADASFERSPGQDGDVFAGNVLDQRHGGPITIGYGRYAPDQSLDEKLQVDDVMIVLEGALSVASSTGTVT